MNPGRVRITRNYQLQLKSTQKVTSLVLGDKVFTLSTQRMAVYYVKKISTLQPFFLHTNHHFFPWRNNFNSSAKLYLVGASIPQLIPDRQNAS